MIAMWGQCRTVILRGHWMGSPRIATQFKLERRLLSCHLVHTPSVSRLQQMRVCETRLCIDTFPESAGLAVFDFDVKKFNFVAFNLIAYAGRVCLSWLQRFTTLVFRGISHAILCVLVIAIHFSSEQTANLTDGHLWVQCTGSFVQSPLEAPLFATPWFPSFRDYYFCRCSRLDQVDFQHGIPSAFLHGHSGAYSYYLFLIM